MAETKDEQQIEKTLRTLPEVPARNYGMPKIVILQHGQTKVICKNHKFTTIIDLHDAPFRKSRNGGIQEFKCDCGTIYQKPI